MSLRIQGEAVLAASHLMASAQPDLHLLRVRRLHPEGHAPIGMDARIRRSQYICATKAYSRLLSVRNTIPKPPPRRLALIS